MYTHNSYPMYTGKQIRHLKELIINNSEKQVLPQYMV